MNHPLSVKGEVARTGPYPAWYDTLAIRRQVINHMHLKKILPKPLLDFGGNHLSK